MPQRPNRASTPWTFAFAASVLTVAVSTALLAFVLLRTFTGESGNTPAAADPLPSNAPLRYTGQLPPGLDTSLVTPAGSAAPDLEFLRTTSPEGAPIRYYIPVTSLGTGLETISAEDLRRAFAGEITTWQQVGGLPGPLRPAIAGPPAGRELLAAWLPGPSPALTFDTTEALLKQMKPGSGILALIPVDDLRPSVIALAVDGADLLRARGNTAAWPFAERILVRPLTPRGVERAPDIVAGITAAPPRPITVVATGDILQSRCTLVRIRQTGDWAAALRGPVGEYLAAADLALGSLDGSIQDIGEPYGCVETTNLTSPPEVIAALTLAGFDELTVATNHVFDCGTGFCGTRAFLRTLELLTQAGIPYAGGGKNLEEALRPVILQAGGVRFGVLAFDDVAAYELEATADSPGTAPLDDSYDNERAAGGPAFFRPAEELDLTRFTTLIRKLKTEVDVVIVQVQSGTEDTHTPSPRSIKALRAAADAGADLVVGNQAHWVQAVEPRGNAFIAYALGNFIFDQRWTPEHTQGYLLEATFLGPRLANVRFVPYQIVDQYRPTFATGDLRAKILSDIFTASQALPPVP